MLQRKRHPTCQNELQPQPERSTCAFVVRDHWKTPGTKACRERSTLGGRASTVLSPRSDSSYTKTFVDLPLTYFLSLPLIQRSRRTDRQKRLVASRMLLSFATRRTCGWIESFALEIPFKVLASTGGGQDLTTVILKGLDPWEGSSSRTRNPFAWIREAFSSTEKDVINLSGLDSAVYFVFLSTVFGIFLLSGIIMLPTLLPLASTEKIKRVVDSTGKNAFNDLDKLSMAHMKVSL
ncbi:CSC1-like protein ERD4 [Tanacetum coccineum]